LSCRDGAGARLSTNDGAPLSSLRLSCWNNSRIVLSSRSCFIENSIRFHKFSQPFLPPFVMRASRTERDAHHISRFRQTQVVIEDQLQNFALAFGRLSERAAERLLNLRAVDRLIEALRRSIRRSAPFEPIQAKPLKDGAPSFISGRLTDHRKQPRPERRPAIIPGFALEHFEIDRMQDAFGFRGITRATSK